MKKIILTTIFLLATISQAADVTIIDEERETTKTQRRNRTDSEYADYVNFFTFGLMSTDFGTGLTLGYAVKVSPQIKLGIQLAYASGGTSSEGGNLTTGQFYKDKYTTNATLSLIHFNYFIREEGVARWGPFIRLSAGYAKIKSSGYWGRYDQDPAFFVFGDGKRLLEEKSYDKDWGTVFGRLGGYYQFAWNFSANSRVGHILELGAGINSNSQTESVSYVKPNGVRFSKDHEYASAYAEVNYVIAF